MPPEIVLATSVDRDAPRTLRTAAMTTAALGLSAPVATEVAMALAESWKPLVKSNASAVTTTMMTMSSVELMYVFLRSAFTRSGGTSVGVMLPVST